MEQIEITEFQKILERNPFCKLLGLEVTSVSEGHVQGRIPFDSRFQNMYGDYHGGALYAAADTFCGLAAITYGSYVTTIDANMQYLRAGRDTEYITYDASVIKRGRTITVVQFSCCDDKGTLINTGTFSFYSKENACPPGILKNKLTSTNPLQFHRRSSDLPRQEQMPYFRECPVVLYTYGQLPEDRYSSFCS